MGVTRSEGRRKVNEFLRQYPDHLLMVEASGLHGRDGIKTLIGHEVVIVIWKEEQIKMRQFDPNSRQLATCSQTAIALRQQLAGSKDIEIISGRVHTDKCISRSLQFICRILDGTQDPKSCKTSKIFKASLNKCIELD